jgi:hypothetical protein
MVHVETFGIKSMSGRKLDTEGCQGIKLNNMTMEVFFCVKTKLRSYGIVVLFGNFGVFKGDGIVAHFSWDGVIEIKERSLNTYCGQVSRKLRYLVHECQGLWQYIRLLNHEDIYCVAEYFKIE